MRDPLTPIPATNVTSQATFLPDIFEGLIVDAFSISTFGTTKSAAPFTFSWWRWFPAAVLLGLVLMASMLNDGRCER
jgi:hypothetical protein